MRLRAVVAILAVAAVVVPAPSAKEGVVATLLADVDLNAEGGSTTRLAWRLSAGPKPFGAGGVFVRLDSPFEGGASTFGYASSRGHADGRYAAHVRIPAGGVGAIRIGLRGWSSRSGRADVYFRIRNDPLDDGFRRLRRPMRVPALAENGSCPVSAPETGVDFHAFGLTRGLGPGPAYPLFDGTLHGRWGGDDYARWGGQKVAWFVHPSYDGRVLVRGRRLDGPQEVRFGGGYVPARELRLGPGARPSTTRVLDPGCYAYQVDGATFSRTIVFRAERA